MDKVFRLALAMIVAGPGAVLAQSTQAHAGSGGTPAVMGTTGSMYDGNNTDLKLPGTGPASFNAGANAGPEPAASGIPPTAATGTGAEGASGGSNKTGGEH